LPTKKVVLYAQPSDEFPYLKKTDLKEEKYEETDALWGALPFTDIGEEAWRAMKSITKDASIRLVKVGFGTVPWTVLFHADAIRAVVTCQKYTSGPLPEALYIEIRADGEDYMVKKFVRRLYGRLEKKPWKMTDWDDFEKATGKDMSHVISAWKKYSQKEQLVKKPKLPEVVDTSTQLEYKQDAIMIKVLVSNQKSVTIKDIRVDLKADRAKIDAECWEQGVPRLNSTGSYTAMFKVRPKGILRDEPLKLTFRYNDGKKKKRELEPVKVTVAPPDIKGEPVQAADLEAQLGKFGKKEEVGQTQRKPAADLFNDLVDALSKTGLFMLDPNIERRGGLYLGLVRLHGKDPDGVQYVLQVKIQGDVNESRVVRTLYSSNPEKVVGFGQFVEGLGVFGTMFEAKS
jgi:hypothetical protein